VPAPRWVGGASPHEAWDAGGPSYPAPMPFALLESWYPEDPATCLLLADAIVVLHFAVVLFVILAEALILAGRFLRWGWVGNRWFRGLHLAIIAYVAIVALMGDLCPLTIWENDLRRIAGKPIEQSSFVAYWSHELLFVDVDVKTLTVCYVAFALLVVASLFITPVRWRNKAALPPTSRQSPA